jgi:K+-transporting ATPase KdpF subunit
MPARIRRAARWLLEKFLRDLYARISTIPAYKRRAVHERSLLLIDHCRAVFQHAFSCGGCRASDRTCGEHQMSWIYVLSALLALGLFAYLLFALFKPEKF